MKKIFNDFAFSTVIAGFIALLVGYTSSAVLVFQAAKASGATTSGATSWLGILCVSMGVLTVVFSLKYKMPVMFAWSTAGGAILMASTAGVALSDTIGAFVFSAFLIFIFGVTGLFEKIMDKIPLGIASAMLAGVLLHFVIGVFQSAKVEPVIILSMFIIYLSGRRFFPRLNIVLVLIVGVLVAWMQNKLSFSAVEMSLMRPEFVMPTFSIPVLIGIGIPLFVVTMSSQNLTGVAVMRAYHYNPKISELITWAGATNILIAPFGGYTLNLSALTAAICMGPESHHDPKKRYTAAIASGVFFIVVGLFSGAVIGLLDLFPKDLVLSLAGLALMSTVSNGLTTAITNEVDREASMVTFFVTASGVSLFGVSAAFWGLVSGALASLLFRYKKL